MVVAPTVLADGARAGDVLPALVLELPAATAAWIPALVIYRKLNRLAWTQRKECLTEVMALSKAVLALPPRDSETTEGRPVDLWLVITQLRPETLEKEK